jgi:hypothetical protein
LPDVDLKVALAACEGRLLLGIDEGLDALVTMCWHPVVSAGTPLRLVNHSNV